MLASVFVAEAKSDREEQSLGSRAAAADAAAGPHEAIPVDSAVSDPLGLGTIEELPAGTAETRHQPAAAALRVSAAGITARYSNIVRVTGTPEEVILDIGLDRPAIGAAGKKAAAPAQQTFDQRLVLSFYTAKRLWRAVELAVQRHEAAFGRLETDVRRRLQRR